MKMKISNKFIKISKYIVSIGALVALIFAIFLASQNRQQPYLEIQGQKIKLDVANTQKLRERGLSGRKNIKSNQGMLFIFPIEGEYRFFNQGMNFPIDIIWIQGNSIVGFDSLPIFKDETTTISPPDKIDKVLELPKGTIDRLNITQKTIMRFYYEPI